GRVSNGGHAEQVVLALAERAPGFNADAVLSRPGDDVTLLVRRVQFDLIDGGNDTGFFNNALEVLYEEVGDADTASQTSFAQFDQLREGVDVVVVHRCRPMHEV